MSEENVQTMWGVLDASDRRESRTGASNLDRAMGHMRSIRNGSAGVISTTAALVVLALVATAPAQATFPGSNGSIAFESTRDGNLEIYMMDSDGDNETRLTNNAVDDRQPAWAPNGKRIAYAHRTDDGGLDIFVVRADGSHRRRLTHNPAEDQNPAWSPGGHRIAFQSDRKGNDDILVIDDEGTHLTQLTSASRDDQDPAWNPVGLYIVFSRTLNGDNDEIFRMQPNGSHVVRLTHEAGGDIQPGFAPSGGKVAFASERDNPFDIFTMFDSGGSQNALITSGFGEFRPAWSPDGLSILFSSTQGTANSDIFQMAANGSGFPLKLTSDPAFDGGPDWAPG
jgi:Tol biopolymer transport system component